MIGSFKKPSLGILNCLTGETPKIEKLPCEVGAADASDLHLVGTGICERHCVFLEARGKLYLVKRDPAAELIVNGGTTDSIVLVPDTSYCIKIGPLMFVVQACRNPELWLKKIELDAWKLRSETTGFAGGPYPANQLRKVARLSGLDPEATIATLKGSGAALYLSQVFECIPAAEPEPQAPPMDELPPPTGGFEPPQVNIDQNGALTCPVCWLRFGKGDVMHIAVHPALKGDPILGEDHMQRFHTTVFTDRGQALDAMNLPCLDIACPHCRRKLPPGLLDVPHHIFPIVGAPSAGKSYYLSVLVKTLQDSLFRNFGVGFDDADPAANAMLNLMKNRLFSACDPGEAYLIKTGLEGEMYETLRRHGRDVKLPRPFIFSLSAHNDPGKACSVVFYDNAGEHFEPGSDTLDSPGAQHIAASAGIFFLFDPAYNSEFRRRLRGNADPQFTSKDRMDQQDIILTEMKVRIKKLLGLGAHQRISTPLAMLVGKCDTWLDLIGRDRLKNVIRHGTLDQSVVAANSAVIRDLLLETCPAIVAGAESISTDVMYFAVSPLGSSPVKFTGSDGLPMIGPDPQKLNPMFVDIPTLWALSRVAPELVPSSS